MMGTPREAHPEKTPPKSPLSGDLGNFAELRHTAPRRIGMQSHVPTTINVYLFLEFTINDPKSLF